jgi:hypothetical protein
VRGNIEILGFGVVVCLRTSKDLHRGHRGKAEENLRKIGAFTAEAQRTQRKAMQERSFAALRMTA